MSSLTLIGEDSELTVRVSIDTPQSSPEDSVTRGTSSTGNRNKHEQYGKKSYTLETTHYTADEVDELENILESNNNILDVNGFISGTFDVTIDSSSYEVFYKGGEIQTTGQVLTLKLVEEPSSDKYQEGGGD